MRALIDFARDHVPVGLRPLFHDQALYWATRIDDPWERATAIVALATFAGAVILGSVVISTAVIGLIRLIFGRMREYA